MNERKKRIVVIGLGDAGLLTAIRLPSSYDVIAISCKPCFVSGQELGNRLAQLEEWKDLNQHNFDRFQKLDHVQIIHGMVQGVDLPSQKVLVQTMDQKEHQEDFDALLIATGTTNGFWRNAKLETHQQIEENLSVQANRFRTAQTIAVVGGGPTGVSAASNLQLAYPTKSVHLFFGRPKVLAGYAERTRNNVQRLLQDQGVQLHANHRAKVDGVNLDAIGTGEIHWEPSTTTNEPFSADAILWAVGAIRPNSSCLPKALLDEDGYVRVTPQLHHPEFKNVFAIGDICASDPNRSTARNAGFVIAAKNLDLYLKGKDHKLKSFSAPKYRWGSILGIQPNGMRVYSQMGTVFVMKEWFTKAVLFPLVVHKFIYKGIRKTDDTAGA